MMKGRVKGAGELNMTKGRVEEVGEVRRKEGYRRMV